MSLNQGESNGLLGAGLHQKILRLLVFIMPGFLRVDIYVNFIWNIVLCC